MELSESSEAGIVHGPGLSVPVAVDEARGAFRPTVRARLAAYAASLQKPWLVTLFVALLYLCYSAWLWRHFGGDLLDLVHTGTYFTAHDPDGTRGYDGQFYYYTASDPWHVVDLMDNASFRLQRIFFPIVIYLVALGQPALVPGVMLLINWLAVAGGTWLLARLLARWGRSPWFALSYTLASGIPVALTFDTAEPLAFGLVLLGVYCWDHPPAAGPSPAGAAAGALTFGRRLGGFLAFAAALLTRELAGPAVAGYAVAAFFRRDWRTFAWAVGAFLPVVLWSTYLSIHFAYLGVAYVQPLEHIPFLAYWLQLGNPTPRSVGYAAQYVVPTLVFGALGAVAYLRTWRRPAALLIGMLGNVYLLTFIHAGGYQHQVAISRYALGLALAAVLWAAASRPRWLLWLTALFAFSFLAFAYGLHIADAAYLW